MDEEVSIFIRLGVMFMMLGAFVSICLNVAIMSNVLLDDESNRYADARTSSGSASILQLQDYPRNYFDIIRIKHEQEELINSIVLEFPDGDDSDEIPEYYVLYLRSQVYVNNDRSKTAISQCCNNKINSSEFDYVIPSEGMVNIDFIDKNLDSELHDVVVQLREAGKEIFINVYQSRDGYSMDIYGVVGG